MSKYRKSMTALALTLVIAMSIPQVGSNTVNAAAKPKLAKKKVDLEVGSTYVLKAKNIKSVKWSVNNSKIVKLTSKKKNSVKLAGKKTGSATVTAKFKLNKKAKKLTCKVNVVKKKEDNNNLDTNKATATPLVNATATAAVVTPTQTAVVDRTDKSTPTVEPTATPIPTAVPTPSVMAESGSWAYIPCDDDTLLKEFGQIFGNVGTCLAYNDIFKKEMQDKATMDFVKKNYNSFTLENEMKPSYLLADSTSSTDYFRNPKFNKLINCDTAKAAGYIIPDDYSEPSVPEINYQNLDNILKTASDNGIRMRAHTLVWHSQTPEEFFRVDYKASGDYVTPDVMNQRIDYYVTNVVKHICESQYCSSVYAYDVANEYFHQLSDGKARNYSNVYKIEDSKGLVTNPEYVKVAFKAAHDVLKSYNLLDKVSLFYNDYNTSQVAKNIVELVNYINATDDRNPDGEKLCNGVGMQSHLDLKWPTVTEQLSTAKQFIEAGFEVQITELDIGNTNNANEESYCEYWYQFLKGLVDMRMNGANITNITFWGLSDSVSWKRGTALLYDKDYNDPKKALYAAYAAAQTSWNYKK